MESRGSSLKLTCMSSQQKDIVLSCTHIGDVEVVASIPNAEARKQQQEAGHSRAERVVISGVSTDIDDDSIQEATEAAQVYRISKRGQSGIKIPTMSVVLSYMSSRGSSKSSCHRVLNFQNTDLHTSGHKML